MPDEDDQIIRQGDHVALLKSYDSGNMKIIPVTPGKLIYYGKLKFDPAPLIGANFGSVFEINDNTMLRIEDFDTYNQQISTKVTDKLATTFNEKSKFSQEKIIKKKKRLNHANVVSVTKPSLLLINEMLYARDKLGGLRPDILAQIMSSANLQNGAKCLLLDHNLGLLTCAVMSRVLPDGVCIQLVPDNEAIYTTRDTFKLMNIRPEKYDDRLLAITMRDFAKIHLGADNFDDEIAILRANMNNFDSDKPSRAHRDCDTDEKFVEVKDTSTELNKVLMRKNANREMRNQERTRAAEILKCSSLDSIIIIAQNDHPLPILKMVYPFLSPSRQMVIYSDTVDPLVECHQYLKSESLAVSLDLSESWFRTYQVLPDRTRPEMNMSGYGGYLLSATKSCQHKNSGSQTAV